MDADRFDALVLHLGAPSTRRRRLGALFGGALALFGWAGPDGSSAKSGKCKPACGECATCKKGDCRRKNGKTRCKIGKCTAKANGTPCAGGSCQVGRCTVAPPPFCSGVDFCQVFDNALCDDRSIPNQTCFCFVTAGSLTPFCARGTAREEGVNSCADCVNGETCVDLTRGELCAGSGRGCALPCPNPR